MDRYAYQQRFAGELLPKAWKAGHRSVLLALPVGAGKTRCAKLVVSRLLSKPGWDVWIIDHRRELTEQFSQEFADLEPSVYWAGQDSPKPAPLRIGGRDTLIRRQWEPCNPKCMVVIDEGHHASHLNTYGRLLTRFRAVYATVYVLGLTATPYALDGRPLKKVYDTLIEPTTPGELIDSGIIVEPLVIGVGSTVDTEGVPLRAGDFAFTELEARTKKLDGNIVEEFKRWSDGYPGLLGAVSIAHSKGLVERFRAAGFRAEHLDGETPPELRDLLLARLAIGGQRGHASGLDILCQVGITGEGWNPPSDYERVLKHPELHPGESTPPPYMPLCTISDCRPTMSMCLYRQLEGRECRPNGDTISTSRGLMPAVPKPWARLISHTRHWERHGFLREHHSHNLDTGEVGGMRAARDKSGLIGARYCSVCLSVWPSGTKLCGCGAELIAARAVPKEDESEKLAPLGARANATPKQTTDLLTRLWLSHFKKNAVRSAAGQTPISTAQISAIFKSWSGKYPTHEQLSESKAKAEALKIVT